MKNNFVFSFRVMQHMIRYIFLSCFFVITFSSYAQKDALTEVESFGANPGNLKLYYHSPVKPGPEKIPMVVALHGCGETAKGFSKLTGWNKLSDLHNFMVLYPQQKAGNNPNGCFNWFNEDDIEKGKGECYSIYEMIIYMQQHFPVDTSRIYITGVSAGGAMTMVMAVTYPALFQRATVYAGGAYKIALNTLDAGKAMLGNQHPDMKELTELARQQNPGYQGKYPPLTVYQGLTDPVVNYRNAAYIINQWAGLNDADTIPDKFESGYAGVKDMSRMEYADSAGNIIITYYEIAHLTHKLMIVPGYKNNEGGKLGVNGINKNYHSTYYIAKEFGILR